ncbi:MAG: MFS transporter [Saprospiraceae bacterium]
MNTSGTERSVDPPVQGLQANWLQFVLLILINAFVGGMVGLERTILPRFAEESFGISGHTAILTFLIAFGITKAISNYSTGRLTQRFGSRNLLLFGWLLAIPVPFILIHAPSWSWVVFANALLGVHQGLSWSSTVIMKIDLVGEKQRGLAMGLNEFAGYLAVAGMAYWTAILADQYGVRPVPFYLGIVVAILGFTLTLFLVKDTRHFVRTEALGHVGTRLTHPFHQTSWRDPNLGPVTFAGFVNNLNDGMMWGLLPVLLAQRGLSLAEIGTIAALYPAVWGLSQIGTGALADRISHRTLLFGGMFLQGIVILGFTSTGSSGWYMVLAVLLGLGTALVYPTFLAAIARATHPEDRAHSMGIFRFWRDLGYAAGALFTGVVADLFSLDWAILGVGLLTLVSGVVIRVRMDP